MNVPPSFVAKLAKTEKEVTEEEPTGNKREDWRKLKELEEARKAGTAPAMQDEEGKDINPHIPQYIMQAPWYFGAAMPTLRHQRVPDEMKKKFDPLNSWYKHGVKEGPVATKYRKGACENCGALGHKKKDCLERPRKIGAQFTNEDIARDEFEQPTLEFDYDGKRDRWNGYDVTEHRKIVEEFGKIEEVKRQIKSQKLEKGMVDGEQKEAEVLEEGEEDDKYADDMAMPGQKFETKQRITVRNLRIREDTAKYLYNMDIDSAYYDPKTRSMRQNPFSALGADPKDLPYAGDNFVRWSGDAYEIAKKQMFAWEAYERGTDVHVQADPTKLEFAEKEFQKRSKEHEVTVKTSILEKYGGQEHLDGPPKQLLLAQTENYVEYSRHGTLLKGIEKAKVKSCYEEDVYEKNHTAIWGSFWSDGRWGYKCCKSLIRGSYCLGTITMPQLVQQQDTEDEAEASQEEDKDKDDEVQGEDATTAPPTSDQPKSLLHQHLEKLQATEKKQKRDDKKRRKRREKKTKKRKSNKRRTSSSSSSASSKPSSSESADSSSDDDDSPDKKLKEAMLREEKRLKEVEKQLQMDERKRPYNVMYDGKGPSEEDIEAFKRKRMRDEDPMAKWMGK